MSKECWVNGKQSWSLFRSSLIWVYIVCLYMSFMSGHVPSYLMLSSLGKIFSRRHIEIFFLIFPRKQGLTFLANCLHCRQYAWNVKSWFRVKIRKYHQFVVCWISLEKVKVKLSVGWSCYHRLLAGRFLSYTKQVQSLGPFSLSHSLILSPFFWQTAWHYWNILSWRLIMKYQGFPSALRSGSPVDSRLSYLRVQQQKSRVHKLNDAWKCSVVFLKITKTATSTGIEQQ